MIIKTEYPTACSPPVLRVILAPQSNAGWFQVGQLSEALEGAGINNYFVGSLEGDEQFHFDVPVTHPLGFREGDKVWVKWASKDEQPSDSPAVNS